MLFRVNGQNSFFLALNELQKIPALAIADTEDILLITVGRGQKYSGLLPSSRPRFPVEKKSPRNQESGH